MFRISCVHHQEDDLYMQFLWYVFHAEITIKGYIKIWWVLICDKSF